MGSTGESGPTTLQPGQSIRPNVSLQKAQELAEEHYGLKVESIRELNSYDDNNFYIKSTTKDGQPGKFTLKVLNSMDSKNSDHIEAEHAVMNHLHKNGINCPIPMKNSQGKTFDLITIKNDNVDKDGKPTETSHILRLLSFVEGSIMHQVAPTPKLCEKAGRYIAGVEDLLKDMSLPALASHTSIWFLSQFLELAKFTFVIEDQPEKFSLVMEVLAAYRDRVVPSLPHLPKGIIHGDFNEQNIIVQPSSKDPGEYDVHGLIDFGDVQAETAYVFELAVTLCYFMLECTKEGVTLDPFVGAQNVIKGYCSVRKVEDSELELLRILVACRLCQSLVMGAYTYSLDPGNEYLLTTAKTGWAFLERVWREKTDEEMMACWKAQS